MKVFAGDYEAWMECIKPYCVLSNNCEHFASSVRNGVRESSQVKELLVSCFLVFIRNRWIKTVSHQYEKTIIVLNPVFYIQVTSPPPLSRGL